MALAFIIAIPIGFVQSLNATMAGTTVSAVNKTETVELDPALHGVCSCESSYEGTRYGQPRQFNPDGSVRRGVQNPKDIGECMINLDYWGETAAKLGYDVFTQQGNVKMANYIYEHEGLKPWTWSNGCHHALD